MEINTNSTWFKVAKAVAMPIPTAVEAIYDAVTDKPAPPPPPPPPPPKLEGDLPDANGTPLKAREEANKIWMKGDAGVDIHSAGAKAEIEELEGRAAGYEKAAAKAEKEGNPKKAKAWREDAAKFREQAAALKKDVEPADTAAVKQLFANRKLEKEALDKLEPASKREQYKKLEAKLENNPQAHLALQMLLLEGKITQAAGNQDGNDLLTELEKLSTAKLADPLKNDQMLAEAVREIAQPATIKQKDKNTCGVASLQVMMASERPSEYVRILTGLSSEGSNAVKLAGKEKDGKNSTIARLDGAEYPDDSGRTSTSRVWQASFMQYAASQADPGATYDNSTDTISWTDGTKTTEGLTGNAAGWTIQQAMGGEWSLADDHNAVHGVLMACAEDLKAKPPKKATLELGDQWGPNGKPGATKTVTLEQYTPAKKGPDGKVVPATYVVKDADGKLAKLTEEDLKAKLRAVPSKDYDREKMTDHLMRQIQDDLGKKQSVVVGLRWGEFDGDSTYTNKEKKEGKNAGHFVTVTKMDATTVYFKNSQGKEEQMPIAEFRAKLDKTIAHDKIVHA